MREGFSVDAGVGQSGTSALEGAYSSERGLAACVCNRRVHIDGRRDGNMDRIG